VSVHVAQDTSDGATASSMVLQTLREKFLGGYRGWITGLASVVGETMDIPLGKLLHNELDNHHAING
jgi:hypothetical protein